ILPLVVGLVVRPLAPRLAARLVPVGGKLATVALVVVVVGTFGANLPELVRILGTGAVPAGIALVSGAFVIGYLLSRHDRGVLLGLGTAQRNIAAAMVIASRDFTNPDVLVM